MADHDQLTGLFNRRRFDEQLKRELARAGRYAAHSAVLSIDIDNFKGINDSAGHAAGDAVLVQVARRARQPVPLDRRRGPARRRRVRGAAVGGRRRRGSSRGRGSARRDPQQPGELRRQAVPDQRQHRRDRVRVRRRHRRRGARQRRPRDVRGQDRRSRPGRRLHRARGPQGPRDGEADLVAAHPGRARPRPLRAPPPADPRARHRPDQARRAAAADEGRARQADRAGRVPARRRALRPDPRDRPLGRGAGDPADRRVDGLGAPGRDQSQRRVRGRRSGAAADDRARARALLGRPLQADLRGHRDGRDRQHARGHRSSPAA